MNTTTADLGQSSVTPDESATSAIKKKRNQTQLNLFGVAAAAESSHQHPQHSQQHHTTSRKRRVTMNLQYEDSSCDGKTGAFLLQDFLNGTDNKLKKTDIHKLFHNPDKMRITEVFQANLKRCCGDGGTNTEVRDCSDSTKKQGPVKDESARGTCCVTSTKSEKTVSDIILPVQGDIPRLALRTEFFSGIKVGWPYPTMLPPQKQMALRIILALQKSQHCVLESPTGTGKSAAILCSTLAWARYHRQTKDEKVKIM